MSCLPLSRRAGCRWRASFGDGPFGYRIFPGGSLLGRQKAIMEFIDKTSTCIDCGGEFVFSAGEQVFFQTMEFRHEPKRCPSCRAKHRQTARGTHVETRTTCASCGAETTVPFRPTQGRPVLCRTCYETRPGAGGGGNGSRRQERGGGLRIVEYGRG